MTTVVTAVVSGPYIAAGDTTFPVTFQSNGPGEIIVQKDGLAVTGWTFNRNDDGTGSVVFGAPQTGSIRILSNPLFSDTVEFSRDGAFYPDNINPVVDHAARRDLWLKAQFDRTIRAPFGDQILELPGSSARANTIPMFDATGLAVNLLSSSALVGVMGSSIASFVGAITKGDPGGNITAIGLFIAASGLTIPAGANIVRTAGYSVRGTGIADYLEDAAVNAAYVTANPRTSFRDTAGRGFRLVMDSGVIDARTWGYLADGTTDNTAILQDIANYLNANGGGVILLPKGTGKVTGPIQLYPKTIVRGAGKYTTKITSTHVGGGGANAGAGVRNGSLFYSVFPSNASTAAFIGIEDLCLENTNASNVGAGYFDNGGTFIHVKNTRILGFKFGIILDQSELADIYLSGIENQNANGAGIWFVQGADLTPGNQGGFTNRISVKNCQLNEGLATVYCILDDGGYLHTFEDNNYNGGSSAIRFAAINGASVKGGEFEAQSDHTITLNLSSPSGLVSGGSWVVVNGAGISAHAGKSSIWCGPSSGNLAVGELCQLSGGGGTAYAIAGLGNLFSAYIGPVANGTSLGPLYDPAAPRASIHVDVFGEQHILTGKKFILDDVNGATYEGYIERVSVSPFRVLRYVSLGGAGTWQGAHYFQVAYDTGSPFDAFKIYATAPGVAAGEMLGSFQAGSFKVAGNQVVGARQTAIANGVNAAAAPTQTEFNALVTVLNSALAALRTHGLIAP